MNSLHINFPLNPEAVRFRRKEKFIPVSTPVFSCYSIQSPWAVHRPSLYANNKCWLYCVFCVNAMCSLSQLRNSSLFLTSQLQSILSPSFLSAQNTRQVNILFRRDFNRRFVFCATERSLTVQFETQRHSQRFFMKSSLPTDRQAIYPERPVFTISHVLSACVRTILLGKKATAAFLSEYKNRWTLKEAMEWQHTGFFFWEYLYLFRC